MYGIANVEAALGAAQEVSMNDSNNKLPRRKLLAGAGTVGALAAAATALPTLREQQPTAVEAKPTPDQGGGYRVTQHVLRYYQTTRV
jgi:hypothetical protein